MRERPGEIFRQHRGCALCGIAEEPFWALGEEFLRLQHLRALQMPDSRWRGVRPRDAITPKRCKIHRVGGRVELLASRSVSGTSPIAFCDMRLHPRIDLREGADGARDRAGSRLPCGRLTSRSRRAAREFRVGVGELQPERHRLGMNAVGAADGRRHLVLEGALLQCRQHLVDVRYQHVPRRGVSCTLRQVSSTSDEVMPWCTKARLGADDFPPDG